MRFDIIGLGRLGGDLLMERDLREQELEERSGYVEDTREVKWAVEDAMEGGASAI